MKLSSPSLHRLFGSRQQLGLFVTFISLRFDLNVCSLFRNRPLDTSDDYRCERHMISINLKRWFGLGLHISALYDLWSEEVSFEVRIFLPPKYRPLVFYEKQPGAIENVKVLLVEEASEIHLEWWWWSKFSQTGIFFLMQYLCHLFSWTGSLLSIESTCTTQVRSASFDF